jgi:uncharacterized damage-inducible protein DinB
MAQITDPIVQELRQEAATTQRVLSRVPEEKLEWRPHPKSMSLGQLALHVAGIPGSITRLVQVDEFEVAPDAFKFAPPKSVSEIQAALDEGVRAAEDCLKNMSDKAALAEWRLKAGGKTLMTQPRIGVVRSIMLNHWYHHRGQLSVYLRLLDVPVPSIYGPSADESPFA